MLPPALEFPTPRARFSQEDKPKSRNGCPQITQMNTDFQQVVTEARPIRRMDVTATPS